MKVRMITTAAGPMGVYQAGATVELPNDMAQTFIEARAAVAVSNPTVKRAAADVEVAQVPAAETPEAGTTRRGRGKS